MGGKNKKNQYKIKKRKNDHGKKVFNLLPMVARTGNKVENKRKKCSTSYVMRGILCVTLDGQMVVMGYHPGCY